MKLEMDGDTSPGKPVARTAGTGADLWRRARALLAASPVDRALVAMALALLGGWLVARTAPVAFGPEALAEWIMARTPADLANALLDRLGRLARPVAVLGGTASYLALALVLGGLERALGARAWTVAGRPAALLLVAAAWGLAVRGLDQPPAANALLLLLFAAAWAWLRRPAERPAPRGRRLFLRTFALSSGAVLLSANVVFLDALARTLRGVRIGGEPLFAWSPPLPRAAGFDVPGLSAEVTPVSDFYRMSKNVHDPVLSAEGWTLRVGGLVAREQRLSYADLLSLPSRDAYVTLRCISNRVDGRLMSTALFSGVQLRPLLERAGIHPAAQTVVFHSPDGHSDSADLARALADDTLIAYAMNGRALTREHGFPARLLVPGLYGFKHVKWLDRIELIAGQYTGHWQELGWTRTARVKTMARIDALRRDGERLVAAGVAYAGDRGVSAVEVRADDGPWLDARLHVPPLSGLAWVQWRAELPAGTQRVAVRSIDGLGVPQDERPQGQFPDGAQGLHQRSVPS